jgi:hypothetical protein
MLADATLADRYDQPLVAAFARTQSESTFLEVIHLCTFVPDRIVRELMEETVIASALRSVHVTSATMGTADLTRTASFIRAFLAALPSAAPQPAVLQACRQKLLHASLSLPNDMEAFLALPSDLRPLELLAKVCDIGHWWCHGAYPKSYVESLAVGISASVLSSDDRARVLACLACLPVVSDEEYEQLQRDLAATGQMMS